LGAEIKPDHASLPLGATKKVFAASTVNALVPSIELSVALIVVPPALTGVSDPPVLMVATPVLLEAHTTELVIFFCEPSL
jgi:hypothetical protein